MSDIKPTDSRRKLLKSIAAGSGAVVAGKTLPESWSKPVVDSIILPAHAELTIETCPPVTIPDIVVNCSDANFDSSTYYVIDDVSNECPAAVEIERPKESEPTILNIDMIHVQGDSGALQIQTIAEHLDGEYECSETDSSQITSPLPWAIESLSGADWMITFNYDVSKSGMSITGIVFTPK